MNLIDAVVKNDSKQVKILLEEGTDPNFCEDVAGITPLHFAAQKNVSMDIVEMLVDAGADLSKETEEGLTPLDVAKFHNNEKIAKFLEEKMAAK